MNGNLRDDNMLTEQDIAVIEFFSSDINAKFGEHYASYIEYRKSCRRIHQIWKRQRKQDQLTDLDLPDYEKWITTRVNNVTMCNESNCFYIVAQNRVFRAYGYHGPNLFRLLSAPNGLKQFASDNLEYYTVYQTILNWSN